MNPTVANLDPKLQEAYNRVMGTQLPQRPSQTQPQPQPVQPQPTQPPPQTQTPAPTAYAQVGGQPETTSVAPRKGIPWWIYVLAGVTFFALYTLFWVRMFNINLF